MITVTVPAPYRCGYDSFLASSFARKTSSVCVNAEMICWGRLFHTCRYDDATSAWSGFHVFSCFDLVVFVFLVVLFFFQSFAETVLKVTFSGMCKLRTAPCW